MRQIKFKALYKKEIIEFELKDLYPQEDPKSVSIFKEKDKAICLNHAEHGINPQLELIEIEVFGKKFKKPNQ